MLASHGERPCAASCGGKSWVSTVDPLSVSRDGSQQPCISKLWLLACAVLRASAAANVLAALSDNRHMHLCMYIKEM